MGNGGYLTGYVQIGSANYFGLMNDLRIYDEVISQKQIRSIYNLQIIHYPLNNIYEVGITNKYSGDAAEGTLGCSDYITRTKLADERGYNYKLSYTGTGKDMWNALTIGSHFPFTAGRKYYYSCKVRCHSKSNTQLFLRAARCDNDWVTNMVDTLNADGEWHEYTVYQTVNANFDRAGTTVTCNPWVEFYTNDMSTSGTSYTFDVDIKDIQVTEGQKYPFIANEMVTSSVSDISGYSNNASVGIGVQYSVSNTSLNILDDSVSVDDTTNANITGVINANSGKIGSFTLDNKYMQSTDETVGLSPTDVNWAFWAGGASMSTVKFRVNHAGVLYATGANISGNITATSGTIGGCSISNGKLIVPSANISGTLNASQIRVGDFTEYHDLTSETYSRYGFSIVADGNNNPWFQHTPQRNIQISPGQGYNSYKCNGGGTYHIEFEVSSTVQASEADSYGKNTYVNINIGLYGVNTSGSNVWYIPTGCRSNSSGSVQKVSTSVYLASDVRSFATFIQCAGFGTFSGTLKIRNISIRRMADSALIVDGSITADKIAANAITADKISVSQLSAISSNLGSITGGSINIGSGKFIVDSNGNFIATNGSLTGTVNASSLTAKQYYKIYDSNGKNERTFVSWSGSMLSFGLVSQNGSNEAEIQILPGSRTVTFNGDIGATQGTIYADSINATAIYTNNKNTSMGVNLYTSGTLTVKSSTTLKSTLHVDGESGFYGKVTARSSFAFLDYNAEEDANATAVFRRPIASAGSNKTKVAFLQSHAGNKISIRAQYGSTSWGTATFTGSSSDIRLKRDIKDSSVNALSKIMQMKIRKFNWKQTGVHQELGCVADELELIDPLLTVGGGYDDDGTMNIKSIDTLLLSEYAIKGIQELYRQNKQQQKRIEYLESQLKNK